MEETEHFCGCGQEKVAKIVHCGECLSRRRADLSLETQNGGIAIADVNGRIDFTALKGGVVLKRVGGAVRGSTTNGGLVIELSGDRWDGEFGRQHDQPRHHVSAGKLFGPPANGNGQRQCEYRIPGRCEGCDRELPVAPFDLRPP